LQIGQILRKLRKRLGFLGFFAGLGVRFAVHDQVNDAGQMARLTERG
jgi:hypothetical protein